MTATTLREFINRHTQAAAGLAGLAAALDARASGTSLDPALATRIEELLATLGGADLLTGLGAQEAAPLLAEIRHQLALDAKLLRADTRTTCWNYADRELLQETGEFARWHAHGLTRNVVPALAGLSTRFAGSDAAFLDIGVGVAGLAIEMARLWPALRIVGIDVWQPSLTLAHENVERVGLRDRIELREQGAERLEDERAFDLAWMPIVFMPEPVVRPSVVRTLRALRPGGWVALAFANLGGSDAQTNAFWRLRTTMFGGPAWLPAQVESMLREEGFVDVRALPSPPGVAVVLVVGRRPPE